MAEEDYLKKSNQLVTLNKNEESYIQREKELEKENAELKLQIKELENENDDFWQQIKDLQDELDEVKMPVLQNELTGFVNDYGLDEIPFFKNDK